MESIGASTRSPLPGLKLLLLGATGTGKTSAIKTWLDAGITPFCIFTEPSFEVLGDSLKRMKWVYLPPANHEFADMIKSATLINQLSMKGLSDLDGINKSQYKEFISLLELCNNFRDSQTGEAFGSIDKFGTDRVLVIDSLSGLNIMAMNLVVGSKPVKSMPDWGISMDNLERLVQKLTTGLRCHFMLTGHTEQERDEVSGMTFTMASTLGRKLAPKIPRFFSDVVLAKREATEFTWSTADLNVDTKARNLPIATKQKPTVVPLVATWQSHGGIIEQDAKLAA